MRKNVILAALVGAIVATPASAAHFVFTSDDFDMVFDLPTSPTPDYSYPNALFLIYGAHMTLDGSPIQNNIAFISANYPFLPNMVGGFSYDGQTTHTFQGVQLYSGTEAAPTFVAGTYHLTGYTDGVAGTLVISVPEPASWAMMVGGFGMMGGAMRRRRTMRLRFA